MKRVALELNSRSVTSFKAHAADAVNDAKMSGIGSDRFTVRPIPSLTPVVAPAPAEDKAREDKALDMLENRINQRQPINYIEPAAVTALRKEAAEAILGGADKAKVKAALADDIKNLQK
jgi:hypothetical protein